MVNSYKCRPSELMDIVDPYTAYCFDEACLYITKKLEDGEEPTFVNKYSSFAELYKQYS